MLVGGKFTSGWEGIYVRTGRQRGADRPRMEGTVNSYRHTLSQNMREQPFNVFQLQILSKAAFLENFPTFVWRHLDL